jgi:hypothetical protein
VHSTGVTSSENLVCWRRLTTWVVLCLTPYSYIGMVDFIEVARGVTSITSDSGRCLSSLCERLFATIAILRGSLPY